MNLPVLLYAIISGVPEEAVRECFGRQRIRIDLETERPKWARRLPGAFFEIQTLCGEYGGYLGCWTDQEGPRAKEAPRVTLNRESNISKMMTAIKQAAHLLLR